MGSGTHSPRCPLFPKRVKPSSQSVWKSRKRSWTPTQCCFSIRTTASYPQRHLFRLPRPRPYSCALLDWQGRGNLYGDHLLAWCVGSKRIPPHGPQSLADWKQFWKSSETGSLQGRVRYQGGDLLSRVAATPETITPEDFRLRPDSAGYRAGKDGKDLGADVDLVGPGPAYERWKKTPEYQQWLKDTKQVK